MSRSVGYGLEIPVTCTRTGPDRAVAWIERKINDEVETFEKMKNKCLKLHFQLLFVPCPPIGKKFEVKSSIGLKKICPLIRVSTNLLSNFWSFLCKNLT